MKIRTDFVTNSSSSSFVAFAVDADLLGLDDLLNKDTLEEEGTREALYEYLEDKDTPLEVSDCGSYDGDEIVVGIAMSTLFNSKEFANVPIGEVRKAVLAEIKKIFPAAKAKEKDIEYVEESWYN